MKYKLAIFDLDGTILDTSEGILSSATYAIKKMGFEVPDEKILKTFIGPPIQKSFNKVFKINGESLDYMVSVFRDRYKNHDLLKAVPYDGIKEIFKALHNHDIKISIATYKRQDYAETIINYFELNNYINSICGSDWEGKWSKKDIILNAIKYSDIIKLEDCVMIGDTIWDYEGAKELGIDFIGVTYGFGFKPKSNVSNVYPLAQKTSDILTILV